MSLCVLKIKDGKYVTIYNHGDKLKLCAVDAQSPRPSVWIERDDKNQTNCLAFKLEYNNECYSPKVVGDSLELVKCDNKSDKLPDDHWFEKQKDGGEHYKLRTVREPKRYVSIFRRTKWDRVLPFGLSDTEYKSVQVKDEAQ